MTAAVRQLHEKRSRRHRPRVTKADLERVGDFLKDMGVKIGAVDIAANGAVRIITTEGNGLTLDGDDEKLNRELAEHRARRGYGTS